MTSSNGNIFRVTGPFCGEFTGPGEFPAQRPVTRSFDVFFYLRPNNRLSKQPWGWWFQTPSWSLWRQCNDDSGLSGNPIHYSDVIKGTMASQINSLTIVSSTVYAGADQRKHQSSASLAFVRGIHRWLVNSPHRWPVTRKMFPFDDVIMKISNISFAGKAKNPCWFKTWTELVLQVLMKFETCCIQDFLQSPFDVHWGVNNAGMQCPLNDHSNMHAGDGSCHWWYSQYFVTGCTGSCQNDNF